MKSYQFILVGLLLIFILTNNIKAQLPAIDSLIIIPTNPTTDDFVKVVSYTTFSSGGCPLTSSSLNISGTTISLDVSHTLGMLTVICKSIDTLTIGKLNAGTYELHYCLYDFPVPTTYDIDTIAFSVSQAVGLKLTDDPETKTEVYPNPTSTEINLVLKTHSADKYDINFYSVVGQKIKSVRVSKDIIKIDISDLTGGIYFIVITDGHDKLWSQKIIKKAP